MDLHKNGIRGKPPDKGTRQSNASPKGGSGDTEQQPGSGGTEQHPVSAQMRAIADWLSKVRFRRQLIGGLDERSVWNRIKELNMLYEEALRAERIRYDSLLEEYRRQSGLAAPDKGNGILTDDSHDRPAESG